MLFVLPRGGRFRARSVWSIFLCLLFLLFWFRKTFFIFWTLLSLPLNWSSNEASFLIAQETDEFDVSFKAYNATQITAGHGYIDRVPPILHHVSLGSVSESIPWDQARETCLDFHPGWEALIWTNENASAFVAEKFPDLLQTWESYPFVIQKVDSLRYMVLYEYGGAVLDMDLRCKRSLGPLRRFGFVAIEAFPAGFSNGFMMAERFNPLIGSIIRNLKPYNHRWLGLPYPTVMFSTGCHFASTIHTLQPNRTDYRILRGPEGDRTLHRLNGVVSTPIFDHLGSSAWHSYDGKIISAIRLSIAWTLPLLILGAVYATVVFTQKHCLKRRAKRLHEDGRARKKRSMELEQGRYGYC